ncbi:protein Turandot B1-like [Drosophila pseudoobscura]|uniref:Protein Turandot B1-like n=1 Tax=Drosophila pseudoobscura pseudoobscura TaxID=46245 RepID=A0A6I8V5K6_DROPS|nr:protein Turandot B1 [Drosophila pseudoobscura]
MPTSSITSVFLSLLFLCLFYTGYTDNNLDEDKRKLFEIYNSSHDDMTKINNIPELVNIYERISYTLSPDLREKLDRIIDENTALDHDTILVDGIPRQGGKKKRKFIVPKVLTEPVKDVASGFFQRLGSGLYDFFFGKKEEE